MSFFDIFDKEETHISMWHICFRVKGRSASSKRMDFRKSSIGRRGGGGLISIQKLYCRFWTFKHDFLSTELWIDCNMTFWKGGGVCTVHLYFWGTPENKIMIDLLLSCLGWTTWCLPHLPSSNLAMTEWIIHRHPVSLSYQSYVFSSVWRYEKNYKNKNMHTNLY